MRIVLVDPYLSYGPRAAHASPLGGTETSFVFLAEALHLLGHDVHVYLKQPTCAYWRGVFYHPADQFGRATWDAAIARWPELFEGSGEAGVRIWWCHKGVDPDSVSVAKRLGVIAVVTSRFQGRQLTDLCCDRGFEIIPLGCRPAFFTSRRRDPLVAVWSSAFDRGLEELIGTWRGIRRSMPPGCRLMIAGGPSVYREYGMYLEQLEERLKADTRREPDIKWVGPLGPRRLSMLLSSSGVMPYTATVAESFCLSVLEAQAAGCLPIAPPLGALMERIAHGSTGWVEPPDRIGNRLRAYLSRPSAPRVVQMRTAARRAAKRFQWTRTGRLFERTILRFRRDGVLA